MSKQFIRIGIDVGGTFTHAVAIQAPENLVVAHAVTPTTHTSENSISDGIIKVFKDVMEKTGAKPEDVSFVAHSTTQATNALLEGDVAKVGIVGMGKGLEAFKAKTDTHIKDIVLSPGKILHTSHVFINSSEKNFNLSKIEQAIETLIEEGCEVIVASEAFSVDDPSNEQLVLEIAYKKGLPATASHEISQLYGLKVRTRTAVINASILPKMTSTAELTDKSIKESGITAPLMIMRSDGGVMDLEQMKKRPILTMLSGPAAGIAAAIMYTKISDGVFLEVGGTSTDIAAIKNGKAMIKSANIGGHLTYLKTLDSRTVGIGGGSMVRIRDRVVTEVGPRSAHIAGLSYLAFCNEKEIAQVTPAFIRPMESDPDDYLVAVNPQGKRFAVTLTDASIVAGMTKPGDYAYGNEAAVRNAFDQLGKSLGINGQELAYSILNKAMSKVRPIVEDLLDEYKLDKELVSLVGGGGGATTVVPWLSKNMEMKYLIAENAEIISAIGVALAMLRDSVERTVVNPTEHDIISIRKEAIGRLESMGAAPETIEVQIEIDNSKNILRATATGAFHMDTSATNLKPLSKSEIAQKAAESFKTDVNEIKLIAATDGLLVYQHCETVKGLFGIFTRQRCHYRVIDNFGIIKLQCSGAALQTVMHKANHEIPAFIEKNSIYNDAGMIIPEVFVLYKSRIADFSTILDFEKIKELIKIELQGLKQDEPVVVIVQPRK